MYTLTFWKAAFERAVKTVAQALVLFFGADYLDWFNMDLERVAGVVIGAAVTSLLTSIVSAPVGPSGSPSLVTDPRDDVHPDAA